MIRGVFCLGVLLILPAQSMAQALRYSTDTGVELAGTLIEGMTISIDDRSGGISTQSFAYLDDTAALTGYHRIAPDEFLLVLDIAVSVGSLTFRAGQVIRQSGDSTLAEFDPVASGVPRGVEVDAVTIRDGDLVISFDTDVELDGTFYADEDLVGYDGATFSMALDGSAFGLPVAADIDAGHSSQDGTWRLSFDSAGNVGGASYRDQDVLALDPDSGAWSMAYDASQAVAGWGNADLDAVWFATMVEPGQLQWSQSAVSVPEDAGQVTLTITRTNGAEGIVAVDFETVADTAAAVDDFGPTNGNIAIGDGVTAYDLDITITEDGTQESDEQFFVDLTQVTLGGAALGSPSRVTVTIQDDDDPDLLFADGFEPIP